MPLAQLSPPPSLARLQTTLPFAAFLDELRRRGFRLGVRHYQDVAALCTKLGGWSGCDAHVMAQGLAALLGNDREQVLEIERLFFERHAEAFQFPPPDSYHGRRHAGLEQSVAAREAARAHQSSAPRRYRLVIALAIVLVSGGILSLLALREGHRLLTRRAGPQLPSGIDVSPGTLLGAAPRTAPATAVDGMLMLHRPLSPKPNPVRISHPLRRTFYGVMPSLLIGLGLYLLRRSKQIERFRQAYWNQRLAALPGPVDFCLQLDELRPPLSRDDLDDMAAVLGRSNDRPANHELDVARSIQATLQRGLLPTLVFSHQLAARHLLVLCDVSREMRIYANKVDALVRGLLRRGVRLSRYNFDGDAGLVMPQPEVGPAGPSLPLALLLQQNPEVSLLVVSLGRELRAVSVENPYNEALLPWLVSASGFPYRAWLHPLCNRLTWNPILQRERFPLPVFPMNRKGLLAAAYELAMDVERRLHVPQSSLLPRRAVTQSDVQNLRRLVALFPSAPLALAELLRQKFHPEVADDVLLPVWLSSQDVSGHTLAFGGKESGPAPSELRAAAVPSSAPAVQQREEERVREYLLALLAESEPPAGSLGHLRWQLARALLAAGLRSNAVVVEDARKTLLQLQQGPIYDQAKAESAERGMPVVRGLAESTDEVRAKSASAGRIRAALSYLTTQHPGGWLARPQLGEILTILLVASLAAWAIHWRAVGVEEYQHLRAYHLAGRIGTAPEFTLYVYSERDAPRQVQLCADSQCQHLVQRLTLRASLATVQTFQLPRPRQDSYYHVQAAIGPGERIAYSDELLIPGWLPPDVTPIPPAGAVKPSRPALDPPLAERTHGSSLGHDNAQPAPKQAAHGELTSQPTFAQPGRYAALPRPSELPDQGAYLAEGQTATPPHWVAEKLAPPPGPAALGPLAAGLALFKSPPLPTGPASPANKPRRPSSPHSGKMVWIDGGTFAMGSNLYRNERPVHAEKVDGFWMDQTEVTELAYRECVLEGRCSKPATAEFCTWGKPGHQHHPINCVTWFQAETYCQWAGKQLPTEAEWEYAAGGAEARKYPWGASDLRADRICWNRSAGPCEVGTHREGDTPSDGLQDMAGNVWEWVTGWYCDEGYGARCQQTLQPLRGGSWADHVAASMRTTNRGAGAPMAANHFVGFRCCVRAK